jgi:TRAP-type C4-dicarboxylate transport system permease small subunit
MKQKFEKLLFWSCGALAAAALFGIMWLTVVDVIGRKFFSNSVPGGLELTEIMMVCVIFAGLPLVSWRGEHVVFDTLDRVIPPRIRALQVRLVHVLCALVFAWLAWLMVLKGMRFASYGETTSYLQLPLYPVSWGMGLLLLVTGVVHLVLAALGEAGEGHVAHAVHQGEASSGGTP